MRRGWRYTQGDTYEDAVALRAEDRLANGEPIPAAKSISVTMLEVPVPKA